MKLAILLLTLFSLVSAARNCRRYRCRRNSNAFENYISVANRAGGSVSLVNPVTLKSVNVQLPDRGEPMYFVCMFRQMGNRPLELWVGDRKNNRLVIFKLIGTRIILDGFLPTPKGLFHSMLTQRFDARRPLAFSTCDIDNVTVVHDVRSRRQLCIMRRPLKVARLGAKPHDVTSDDKYAFVTYLGASDGKGYVASYVARTCKLIRFIATAKDPHVAVRAGTRLFIAAQGGEVLSRSIPKLLPRTRTRLSSPHGIAIGFNSRFFYVTNIADGGENAVVVFRVSTGKRAPWCPTIKTTHPVPHNCVTSCDDNKLYITHTIGGKSFNSAWDVNIRTGCLYPGSEKVFLTGDTPFGIAIITSTRVYRKFLRF